MKFAAHLSEILDKAKATRVVATQASRCSLERHHVLPVHRANHAPCHPESILPASVRSNYERFGATSFCSKCRGRISPYTMRRKPLPVARQQRPESCADLAGWSETSWSRQRHEVRLCREQLHAPGRAPGS